MYGLNAEILIQILPCKAGEVSVQPHSMVDLFFPISLTLSETLVLLYLFIYLFSKPH